MRALGIWFSVVVAGAVSGCSAVYVTKPVGEIPCPVKAGDWDGTWVNKNGTVTLRVQDGEAGRIGMAWVEWGIQGPRLESHEIQLLRSGDVTFASVKDTEEDGQTLYVFVRLKREGDELVCWVPDVERFKAACRSGQFPFREKDESLVLGELTPDHIKLLASPEAGLLYRWDDPVVFVRASRNGD
jgi:hypothetical protein